MYEFGEELIIGSYKVPWLIWIQLLVMILLVVLLFFGFSILDLPNNSSSGASSSSSSSSSTTAISQGLTGSSHDNSPSNSTGTLQQERERRIPRADERAEKETSIFVRPQHPCNYFGLAKQAFLKCFGFHSDPHNCL